VHINKTGGSSISDLFVKCVPGASRLFENPLRDYDYSQHLKAAEYRAWLGAEYNDFYKFSFVRNPWDRVVSLYLFAYIGHKQLRRQLPNLGHEGVKAKFNAWVQTAYVTRDLPIPKKIPLWMQERGVQPCYDWIYEDGELLVDDVFRFERLEQDVKEVFRRLGCRPGRLLRHLKNNVHRRHYHDYYDDVSREVVRREFIKDIETWGYEF
jgi:hypothetical protein